MRRIFGNNPLATSSTSNSLASDSLPSPVPSNASSQHSPFPASSSSQSLDQRPQQRSYDSYNSTAEEEPQRKGWFGGSGGAAAAIPRSGSSSSGSYVGATNGRGQPSPAGRAEDEVEAIRLPIGAAARHGSTPQSRGAAAPPGHSRSTSRSSGWASSAGGQPATGRPFSPPAAGREGAAPSPVGSQSTAEGTKDAMLVELLSGQAVVEAREYQIMEWDEMQEVKKEHALLATRIATLTRALALETRLRDSAAKLARLSAPASSTLPSLPSTSSKPRVTREQAEAQVAAANAKMETVSSEMYKLGWKEAELRTRLLRHTAGVLGLAMRKKEEEEARVQQTPLPGSNNGAFSPNLASASGRTSQLSDRATPLSPASRFEGRHFFAGNKDAIAPTSRGAGASSPISSPRLGAAINGSSFGGAHAHFDDGSAAKVRELEAKVSELQAALQTARDGEAAGLDKLREELGAAHRRESGSREEAKVSRREAIEGKRELSELRREVEVLRDDLKYAKEAGEKGKRELEEARAEVDSVKNYGEVKRDIEEARGREEEAKEEIERVKQEVSMAERRLNEAEAKVAEVEDELERVREEGDDEIRRLQDELEVAATSSRAPADEETEGERQARADLALAHEQHAAITQVVGDVLHRHRTGQPVLRDLPSFDDSADPADLAAHLSSTLDSHFDRLTSHVNDLSTELDSTRAEHETVRNDLETNLREASQHRDQFRAEADEHRGSKEELERAHEELQHRVREQEEQLASLGGVQSELASKVAEGSRLRQELSAVKMTLSGVQAQLRELSEEREGHKARADTAEKEAGSKKEEAARLEQQIKDLEERMAVSANQEVTMLERLNDLTESLEQTRAEKRKLDGLVATHQSTIQTLTTEKDQLKSSLVAAQVETSRLAARPDDSAKLGALENELQDARDQLQDAMEELEDAKGREARTRAQLLEELSGVQSELSSTRTKLRQAERRGAK